MTDLSTQADTDEASNASATPAVADDTIVVPVEWAPTEPARRSRKKLWWWIGVPAGLVLAGVAAASTLLIAPGTTVGGVSVGFLTAGAATDAIDQRLAATSVTLAGEDAVVTGADLGAHVDAVALADAAFQQRPLWNVTQWFGEPIDAAVTLDPEAATTALRAAAPVAFTDPVPATVAFNGTSFAVTPAVDGAGIDVDQVATALRDALANSESSITITPESRAVPAAATTAGAQAAADKANALLQSVGFYVGDERTVPIDAATAASWMTIAAGRDGTFTITADPAKIQSSVDALPAIVNRAPSNGAVITNAEGAVLETTTPGLDGRTLGDTSSIAKSFADQLRDGNGSYALPVEVTPATMATSARMVEVNLSEQRLYMRENGNVIDSWPISSGVADSPTTVGHFTVKSHHDVQTMSSTSATDDYWNYEVPNVQWIMYFYGGEALHGVYWHNDFGNARSHGCVGMPNWQAKKIYDWLPDGGDVWIHN